MGPVLLCSTPSRKVRLQPQVRLPRHRDSCRPRRLRQNKQRLPGQLSFRHLVGSLIRLWHCRCRRLQALRRRQASICLWRRLSLRRQALTCFRLVQLFRPQNLRLLRKARRISPLRSQPPAWGAVGPAVLAMPPARLLQAKAARPATSLQLVRGKAVRLKLALRELKLALRELRPALRRPGRRS